MPLFGCVILVRTAQSEIHKGAEEIQGGSRGRLFRSSCYALADWSSMISFLTRYSTICFTASSTLVVSASI